MDYTLLENFSQIQADEWNALLKESVSDTPFLRYEYQKIWWEHRGGGEWQDARLRLVVAREGENLVGVAPLFVAEHEGQPALLLNGSIEISDYLDVIVREKDHAQFIGGLLDFLAASPADVGSRLDWYNLPDDSPTLAALKIEGEKRGWTHSEEIYQPTPRIALNGSFDDYLAKIDKKQRHEIRRKMRRAAESDLGVRFVVADSSSDFEAQLNDFFELMKQDPQKENFLHPAMREQMAAFLRSAHEGGYLWLAFLEVGGKKTAAALNFDYNGKFWGYNSGVSREYMELSPGWVLTAQVIQWCCENGRYEFDFMRGDEEYKYRFGGVNRYVMRVRLSK
ncbi:MAG: GNAT family N-acetyltransferase [Anaerolineales bacterium]|nr:GNAT family N-acetyltransferase [Anaerolineales bacterium]